MLARPKATTKQTLGCTQDSAADPPHWCFVLSSSCKEYLCKNEWSSYCQEKWWGPCPISCGIDQTYCTSYVYDSEGRKPVPSTLAEIASEKSHVYQCCSFTFLVANWMVGTTTVLVVGPRSSLHSSGQETPTGQPQCVSLVQTRLPALAMLELNSESCGHGFSEHPQNSKEMLIDIMPRPRGQSSFSIVAVCLCRPFAQHNLRMHNGRTSVLIPSTTTVGAPQKCILAQSHVLWTSRRSCCLQVPFFAYKCRQRRLETIGLITISGIFLLKYFRCETILHFYLIPFHIIRYTVCICMECTYIYIYVYIYI